MSFGGFGGFGQNNNTANTNQQPTGFGGFGANNTTTNNNASGKHTFACVRSPDDSGADGSSFQASEPAALVDSVRPTLAVAFSEATATTPVVLARQLVCNFTKLGTAVIYD